MQHSVMECCILSCLAIHISAAGRKTLGVQKKFFLSNFFEGLIAKISAAAYLHLVWQIRSRQFLPENSYIAIFFTLFEYFILYFSNDLFCIFRVFHFVFFE